MVTRQEKLSIDDLRELRGKRIMGQMEKDINILRSKICEFGRKAINYGKPNLVLRTRLCANTI